MPSIHSSKFGRLCRSFAVALALAVTGGAVADDEGGWGGWGGWGGSSLDIDSASWSGYRDRLTVSGSCSGSSNVTVTNADTGAVVGSDNCSRGSWEVRKSYSSNSSVACRVHAEQSGSSDERNVSNAPSNCDDGGGSGSASCTISPQNPSINTGESVTWSATYTGFSGTPNYSWTFEGGNPGSSSSSTRTVSYANGGDYATSLTLSRYGTTATCSTTVQVGGQQQSGTSINSTSQSCGTADESGNGIVCNDNPVPERPIVGNSGNHTVVAINDLGMHCGDLDTRISSILPPFQVLLAQVIQKGSQPQILSPNQVDVFYSAASNPDDPILGMNPDTVFRGLTADGSVYKTNFWDYPVPAGTYDAFYPAYNPLVGPSAPLTPLAGPPFNITYDVGLPVPNVENLYLNGFLSASLQDMPGVLNPYVANDPQQIEEHLNDKPFFSTFPFGYVANNVNWFEAAGIPFSAYDDAGRENAYPLVRVEARSTGGSTLATLDTVLPISGEASCKNCHADPMDPNFTGSRTTGPTDELESAGLPVVSSDEDPLFQAGKVPVDVAIEWATDINVLRLHDKEHGADYVAFCDGSVSPCPPDPCTISDTNPDGSDSCLTNQALVQQKPVVCQVCHYTPALDLAQLGPLAGPEGTVPNGRNQVAHESNSRVLHNHHAQFTDLFPPLSPPVQDGNGGISNQSTRMTQIEESCYQCHPGKNVQCLRGAMFDGGMLCNDCHGGMQQVGADFTQGVSPQNPGAFKLGLGNYYDPANTSQPRVPWANEPGCGSCHTGDYSNNLAGGSNVITNVADSMGNADNIRLRQAWRVGDAMAKPIVPSNKRFAENAIPASFNGAPNPGAGTSSTGAANPKLYRVSTGHGGVFCEGCHGATHAEFDSDAPSLKNDDVAAIQLQGHSGTVTECTTCHGTAMNSQITLNGPHGMHPVGDNTRFADGGHEHLAENNLQACQACHGPGGRESNQAVGTVLSVAKADRDFRGLEHGGRVAKGEPIGCRTCHD